ncbi:MAG: FecR domain-containing protein [Prevotellaceae bacterium]|jgi:ferric-dicitrate binding protein FerR (iron transport regulator)|nr:FecR domain-containing protein [Prevotellaceae bacterium]
MLHDFSDIDRIIARHLGGEATPREQETLQAWLCESEGNRAYFSALLCAPKPNVDKAWKKFEQHMADSKFQISNSKFQWWQPMMRYAAAAVLLIGLSIFAWIRFDNSSLQMVAENTQNSTQQHTLQDSTSVHLSQGSSLAYVGKFGDKKREVQLEGEAFFEIAEASSGQFLVHAEETFIKDIGTSFNVQAYPDSDSVMVFVQSGEVQFYSKDKEGILVQAGETGIYHKRSKTFTRLKKGETNIAILSAKLFVFKDKPLSDALALLNKEYGVHIAVDSAVAQQSISATFDNEAIEEIVEVIGETMQLSVAQVDSIFVLKKK